MLPNYLHFVNIYVCRAETITLSDNLSNHQFTQEILKQHITQFSHYFSVLTQANLVSIVITNQGSLNETKNTGSPQPIAKNTFICNRGGG
jgi:hypothetical protein